MLYLRFNVIAQILIVTLFHTRSRFKALYKGLVPKVLRLGPGGAIMLVVYDYMHVFLTEKFKD